MISVTENSNKSPQNQVLEGKISWRCGNTWVNSTGHTSVTWKRTFGCQQKYDKLYSTTWNRVEPFVTSHCYVPNKAAGVGLSKHIMFVTTPVMAGCIEMNCGRHYSKFLQNKWRHNSTSSLSNSIPNLCFMYMFHSSYESNWCWGFIPAIFSGIF